MKLVDIHSGDSVNYYATIACIHSVLLRQAVLGVLVKILLPWAPCSKTSPKKPLLDHMSILDPKDELLPTTPISEQKGGRPEPSNRSQPVPTGSRQLRLEASCHPVKTFNKISHKEKNNKIKYPPERVCKVVFVWKEVLTLQSLY